MGQLIAPTFVVGGSKSDKPWAFQKPEVHVNNQHTTPNKE
jgi:hypothetical protein